MAGDAGIVGKWGRLLRSGAFELGVPLTAADSAALVRFAEELLRWNRKMNLTSVTEPGQVVEKHLLDSLAIVPDVPRGARVLDAGTGAGLPGIPVAVARPDVQIVMVDRTEKKVAFVKTALALLRLRNASARHVRLVGRPEEEGVGIFDVAVSRAFANPVPWLELARKYVRPGGRIILMLAGGGVGEDLRRALNPGERLVTERAFHLPAGDARVVAAVELPIVEP